MFQGLDRFADFFRAPLFKKDLEGTVGEREGEGASQG